MIKLKNSKKRKDIKKSLKFFKDVKYQLLLIAIFYILLAVLGFVVPIIEANLITSITDTSVNKVILFAVGFLIVIVFENIFWYVCHLLWKKKIRTKILFNIRKEIVDNILELKVSNFDKQTTGFFQERVRQDPELIARVVNAGQRYLTNFISKLGVIIYIMCINWVLGLIYIGGIVIVTLIDIHAKNVTKEKNRSLRNTDEEVNSILSELIRGIRDIKLLNFKNTIRNNIIEKLDKNNDKNVDKSMYQDKMEKITFGVIYVTVFLVVVVGIKFVDLGFITAANLITLYLYNSSVFSLMSNFAALRDCIKEYELAVERIYELNDDEKYPKDKYGKISIDNFKGKITFKDVTFGYTKNKFVLNKLSLNVEPKDTIAIIGESGSGKTTIFNLITKSYDVTNGKLKLDDIDINELDEDTIRKNVSIITQSPYIFNMSIKDNLRLVKPNATKKELDEVCKEACFYDYVMSLPDKYDTIIGEGGVNLSGGQKQRLAIARALLKDCKILLFDEATSALDNITQKEIQESIDNISKDYTIIIVAHRLSTIKNCNKIYMLSDGKIVDSGTHNELMKNNKAYQKLYKSEIEV